MIDSLLLSAFLSDRRQILVFSRALLSNGELVSRA